MSATGTGRASVLAGRTRHLGSLVADRPPLTAIALAVLGLVVRQAWITTRPLAAGDWHWPSRGRMTAWFPWPTIWDSTLGFGGENRFLEAFRFPVFSASGAVATLGATWTVAEKVVYFFPYAILVPIAAWLLAREVLGPTRWTLLAPLLLLGNTYFTLESNGHVPLPLGELLGCLALVALIRALRCLSTRWAILAGLLVSAAAVGDFRAAYITILLMFAYLLVVILCQPEARLVGRRVLLAGTAGATFVGTQLFWILPLATYHGHPGFPTPQAPNFNIITLGHGISGVAAGWSGGVPAPLVQAPLNPWFMVLPVLAMVSISARKVRPELLWLALVAVVFAFLAKTNTPPLGGVYNTLYRVVPGFQLFREGSKFLFPVGIAYSVLVPASLQALFERGWVTGGPGRTSGWLTGVARVSAVAGLTAAVLISGSVVLVLESGKLGSSTTPLLEPAAFQQMDTLLTRDHTPGSVLWFGQPVYNSTGDKNHRYVLASKLHPAVNMTGNARSTLANQRDDFQYFCPATSVAYCYLRPDLFPYLVTMSGSSYIVSPGSEDVGALPPGVTRSWLRQQLTAIFGPPTVLGHGTSLLVWHAAHVPVITGYPAVASVDSGPWSTEAILPALEGMGVPAAYRQSFSSSNFPPAPSNLADSVGVVPYVDGGYRSSVAGQMGLMAKSTAASITVSVGGSARTLPLLTRATGQPQWGVYGPVALPAGFSAASQTGSVITGPPPGTTGSVPTAPPPATAPTTAPGTAPGTAGPALGPAVTWSPLTMQAFGNHAQPVGPARVGAGGEQVTAPVSGSPPWVVLTRLYDPGWRIGGHKPVGPAGGLFNLYRSPKVAKGRLKFTFSTMKWERRGQVVALGSLVVVLFFLIRKRRKVPVAVEPLPWVGGRLGRQAGAVGVALLAVTAGVVALQWVGWPTRFPQLTLGADPYTLEEVTGFLALILLAGSVLLRLGRHAFEQLMVPAPTRPRGRRRRTALVGALCLVTTACTGGRSGTNALSAAQAASTPTAGAAARSLNDAELLQAARQPRACITNYTAALRSFPKLASAYSGRATCYLSGSISALGAVHDDTKVVSLTPSTALAYLQLAGAFRAIGNFNAAVRQYAKAASLPSAVPGDVLVAVDGTLIVGSAAQAGALVKAAMTRFPQSAVIDVAAADVALADDDGTVATHLTRAMGKASGSNDEQALVSGRLCRLQILTQQYQQALASCARAAQVAGNGSGAFDNLGAANAALGNLAMAIGNLTSAIGAAQGSAGPFTQLTGVDGFGLATLYEARGRLEIENHQADLAIADYQRARGSLPGAAPDFRARLKADIKTARLD